VRHNGWPGMGWDWITSGTGHPCTYKSRPGWILVHLKIQGQINPTSCTSWSQRLKPWYHIGIICYYLCRTSWMARLHPLCMTNLLHFRLSLCTLLHVFNCPLTMVPVPLVSLRQSRQQLNIRASGWRVWHLIFRKVVLPIGQLMDHMQPSRIHHCGCRFTQAVGVVGGPEGW
jgi:hypothetical protein